MAGSIGIMIDLRPHSLEDASILTFGACLSAGPIKDSSGNWPPVNWTTETDPTKQFAPYKPWDWSWAADTDLAKPAADQIGWSVWVRHSSQPNIWHRLDPALDPPLIHSIDSTAGVAHLEPLYKGILNDELARIQLLDNDGNWRNGSDSVAHSRSFEVLWSGSPVQETDLPTSDDSSQDPGFKSDRLMSALARWSTARPPLNFAVRLAWAIHLNKTEVDALVTRLAGAHHWPDTLPENIQFAAIPFRGDQIPVLGSIGADLAKAVLPAWDPRAPAGLQLQLACNSAIAPAPSVPGVALDPEVNNWRRLMASRVVRFLALPEMILELASAPQVNPTRPRWHDWLPTDLPGVLRNLWTWIVAGSADIFTASVLGGKTSWWNECANTTAHPPPTLFTSKRTTPLEWVTWLATVTKPQTKLPQTTHEVPVNDQWQSLFNLVSAAAARLSPANAYDFEAALRADPSGRAELNLMTEFLHNLQAPEVLRLLLPELWKESGQLSAVVDKLSLREGVTMLGGKAPDETIQPALALARVRAHWDALFGNSGLNDYLSTLVAKLGGPTGIVVTGLYQPRTSSVPTYGVPQPINLPDLGAIFRSDLAELLPPDLDPPKTGSNKAKEWLAGDMTKAIAEPHGITLPLAPEEAEVDRGHEISSIDALQQNAGFLIFAKEVTANKWRCLTQAKPVGGGDWGTTVLAVPVDLGFQDGRLACTVTYNNQPLAARSPADELVKTLANRGEHDPEAATWDPPLLRYEMPPPDGTLNTGLIPGLVYGRNYEFAALPVKNSGLLPLSLRNSHPASLDFTKLAAPTFAWSGVPGAITYNKKVYLRRVGIGAPRVADWQVDPPLPAIATRSSWPQIPTGVLPLAAEIRLPDQDDLSTAESEEPIALLFPPVIFQAIRPERRFPEIIKGFTLDISKPASDLENWDRWVAKDLTDDAGKQTRSKVWARVYKERDDETDTKHTMSPDDPALGDYLLLQLERLYAPPSASGPTQVLHVVKYSSSPTTFQSKPIRLNVTAFDGGNGAVKVAGTVDGVFISVPEGQVWRVTLFNLVPTKFLTSGADPRLDADVFAQKDLRVAFPNATFQGDADVANHLDDWFACSSHTFRIETVSNTLPDEKELWHAVTPAESGDQIQLSLDYSAVTNQALSYVSSLDIRHQIWRWNGRPAETDHGPPPGETVTATPDDDYAPWDGIGFHEREDSQHRLITQRLTYRPNTATLPKVLIFTDDRSGDDRALYSRFGLTAYSRYYSVTGKSVTARHLKKDTSTKREVIDAWRRHLMPARLSQPLKRPLIRAILPVTSSENLATVNPLLNRASSPGMMLLLAEPFYQQAGILEQLECEVMTGKVEEPASSGNISEYLQAGFDPVISRKKLDPLGNTSDTHLLDMDPPVGLTFDVGATDPHIVSSCFFGRVPEGFHAGFADTTGRTGATAANTFFKVHVRRVIRPRMEPPESSAETEARDALASEWTESEWVRLLPDASALLLAWPAGVDGSRSVVLNKNGTLNIPDWNNPLPWPAEGASDFLSKRFSYALLVSRLLPDTSGRLREIYQCALRGDESGNFTSFANENALSISGSEETVLIRIIELFHREPLQLKIDLWETLFPKEPEQPDEPRKDAGARIDRMSSPFKATLRKT